MPAAGAAPRTHREILTGQPVYMGLDSDQIIERVQAEGLR